jgi:hypothetical protein
MLPLGSKINRQTTHQAKFSYFLPTHDTLCYFIPTLGPFHPGICLHCIFCHLVNPKGLALLHAQICIRCLLPGTQLQAVATHITNGGARAPRLGWWHAIRVHQHLHQYLHLLE